MTTGFIYDDAFLGHDTGPGHPERAARLQSAMQALARCPWYEDLRSLTPRSVADEDLFAIHTPAYVQRADNACVNGVPYLDCIDVPVSGESARIARLAAGSPLALLDDVVAGGCTNAFALLRPPGHHAERDQALGFCLFNNVAVLARYAQRRHGLDKVAIVDWDVHHGNGTQHTFESDPSVLYVSTHQYPFYPGTGAYYENGTGRGIGATLNCPMPAGAGDEHYHKVFVEKILPKLDAFKPDLLIISAGFDAHADDPLAQVNLTTDCFGWMTGRLLEVADRHCAGRLVSVLEGGYHLQRLADCVTLHVATLAGSAVSVEADARAH